VSCKGASADKVNDSGDGSYTLDLTVVSGRERSIELQAEIRDRTLRWTWAELAGESKRPTKERGVEPPLTWPRD
jgi:hypothetical protein